MLKFAGATALATVVIAGGAVAAYRLFGTGTSTTVEPVSFSSLRPGACFQDPPGHRLARGPAVGVAAVPCTAAHSAQVIARFPLAGNRSYPGRSVLARLAARDCRASVTAIEKSKAGESARVLTLFPGPMAWRDGIRAISCVAVGESRDLSTSLVKMAGKGTPSSPGPSGAPRHATAPAQRKGGGSAGPAPKSHRP